jgi:hypothetical protein
MRPVFQQPWEHRTSSRIQGRKDDGGLTFTRLKRLIRVARVYLAGKLLGLKNIV